MDKKKFDLKSREHAKMADSASQVCHYIAHTLVAFTKELQHVITPEDVE